MTKLYVCGQAPSRVGDGRAFSGPSGKRLASLFGLRDYEALAEQVYLTNIFPVPAKRQRPLPATPRSKRVHAGDEFNERDARDRGIMLVRSWSKDPELVVVIAAGAKVYKALTGNEGTTNNMFAGKALQTGPVQGVDIWHFPHPSGSSHYWNDPLNVKRARDFLKRLLDHYSIELIDHAGDGIPPD